MVPVGGSVIYSHKKKDLIDKINKFYPGRASGGPIVDLFLTFLEIGSRQLNELIQLRKDNYLYLQKTLSETLALYRERILVTKNNKISLACTLSNLNDKILIPNSISPTFFGSYLFSRRVSGVRVVAQSKESKINDSKFLNYGSHS